MNKTFVDLILEESKNLNGYVYSDKPYSCGLDEAISYFKGFKLPEEGKYSITREEKSITIDLKPMKGSGKRKHYLVKLWIA